jgi:DNA-directed RNA polymerase subunit K/omega
MFATNNPFQRVDNKIKMFKDLTGGGGGGSAAAGGGSGVKESKRRRKLKVDDDEDEDDDDVDGDGDGDDDGDGHGDDSTANDEDVEDEDEDVDDDDNQIEQGIDEEDEEDDDDDEEFGDEEDDDVEEEEDGIEVGSDEEFEQETSVDVEESDDTVDIINAHIRQQKDYMKVFHPECGILHFDEIKALSIVTRNEQGHIVDNNHLTTPLLTKYEKAKIIGFRVNHLNDGDAPYIRDESRLAEMLTRDIAVLELNEKLLPYIIRRPLPNGTFEYWRLEDLEIFT